MKVEFQPQESLSEIGGNYLEYSLLLLKNDVFKGQNTPFVCKDFLSDMFWCLNTQKDVNIYGFKWKFKDNFKLLNNPSYYLGLRLREESNSSKFVDLEGKESSLSDFVNQIEEKLGFPLSSFNIDETGKIIVVDFFKEWTLQPHLISLFTLLVRVGLDFTEGDALEFMWAYNKNNNNFSYLKQARKPIEYLLAGKSIHKDYNDYDSISNIHNKSGIVSVAAINLDVEEIKFVLKEDENTLILEEEPKMPAGTKAGQKGYYNSPKQTAKKAEPAIKGYGYLVPGEVSVWDTPQDYSYEQPTWSPKPFYSPTKKKFSDKETPKGTKSKSSIEQVAPYMYVNGKIVKKNK